MQANGFLQRGWYYRNSSHPDNSDDNYSNNENADNKNTTYNNDDANNDNNKNILNDKKQKNNNDHNMHVSHHFTGDKPSVQSDLPSVCGFYHWKPFGAITFLFGEKISHRRKTWLHRRVSVLSKKTPKANLIAPKGFCHTSWVHDQEFNQLEVNCCFIYTIFNRYVY